jgi:hypothetical protein
MVVGSFAVVASGQRKTKEIHKFNETQETNQKKIENLAQPSMNKRVKL